MADRLVGAAVVDRDRRFELIVGINRDPGYCRLFSSNGRLLRQEKDLLPLADRRFAVLDAERGQNGRGRLRDLRHWP